VAEEKKTAELKATEKPAGKSKAFQERPQLGKEPEGELVRKKPRIEAARTYLKSIGSAVKGIPIRAKPLAMTAFECLPQSTEKEAVPQHPARGEEPVLCDEDILSMELVGQDVTLPSMVGEGVAQTAPSEIDSALPELLNAQVEAEIEPRQISQPRGDAEVSDDMGSIQVEAESGAAGPSVRPIVCLVAERAKPSSSRPFVELGTEEEKAKETDKNIAYLGQDS
jgi:hypothetical protein